MKDVTPSMGWFSWMVSLAGVLLVMTAGFAGGSLAWAAAIGAMLAGYAWGVDYGRRYIRANRLVPKGEEVDG